MKDSEKIIPIVAGAREIDQFGLDNLVIKNNSGRLPINTALKQDINHYLQPKAYLRIQTSTVDIVDGETPHDIAGELSQIIQDPAFNASVRDTELIESAGKGTAIHNERTGHILKHRINGIPIHG